MKVTPGSGKGVGETTLLPMLCGLMLLVTAVGPEDVEDTATL